MRISGINEGYDYNKISAERREIPQVTPLQVQDSDGQVKIKAKPANEDANSQSNGQRDLSQNRRQLADSDEVVAYAKNAGLYADKELIGSESDIMQLDVEKAVSSMKRDSVLQGYQYFVGNISSEDGMVVRK